MSKSKKLGERERGLEEIQKRFELGDLSLGDLRRFIREKEQVHAETRDQVNAALKFETEKSVSFAEACKLLEGKIDLEAARRELYTSHSRWGLVDALYRKGVIEHASQYPHLFERAIVSEIEIKKVCESLKSGKKVLPIFDPGVLLPYELFTVLLADSSLSNYCYMDDGIRNLRRIDSNNIPDLENLVEKSDEEKAAAFRAAYQQADHIESIGPRVIFTLDECEVSQTGTSAIEDMQFLVKNGVRFIDPSADVIRFRTQIDAGLRQIAGEAFDGMTDGEYGACLITSFDQGTIDKYMPDRQKITRYSNYAYSDGSLLSLCFHSNYDKISLKPCHPKDKYDWIGYRTLIG